LTNFIIIFICLVAGWLCRKVPRFPEASGRALNSFVIYLSLPALILNQFPALLSNAKLEGGLFLLALMPWFVFFAAMALFTFVGKTWRWPAATTAGMILTAGLGNTSFVGFPLLEALIGPQAIRYGVVVDQFGSFLVLSLVGIPFAAARAGGKVSARMIFERVLTFPPFVSVVAACVWYLLGLPGQDSVRPALEKLAGTLVPLALFAVGFQIRADLSLLKKRSLPLVLGLIYKLAVAPLMFFAVHLVLKSIDPETMQVAVLQAGMAPMITAGIVANEFGLDGEIANLMVAIGIPLSLLTVPILHTLF
jgi:predicted permease